MIGFNAREGLTLHHLGYDDGGRDRSILYRASLTGDGRPLRRPGARRTGRKNAFDVGEYGMGMLRQQPDARLRLPRPDPLLRRRTWRPAAASR